MTDAAAGRHAPPVRRTAVVTGAASGLGQVMAEHLAATGHDVAVCDVVPCTETAERVRAHGRRAATAIADVSSPEDVAAFAATGHEELGPVGVLVNNVGVSPYRPFLEIGLDEWRSVMRVNLDGLLLVTQAFLPDMVDAGAGRVVCMTSSVVWDPQSTEMTHYATSKAGVWGFTRSLAGEVGRHGVTVNCIAPGLVRTPLLQERVPPERWAATASRQAVPRTLEPADLLVALDYLLSDAASAVTGTTVPVNGGRVWL
ncbi:SDR family oxidoreductase [Geodermatophilus sp. DF01-2]|uniref:SDR family NAD(P)-dependent oxidoreductase n=1 Tax=Geodermatophilus sp. DF01-2 TaxID=2559610 RepID=UPI001073909A|nr:SDR family NAD(P)-dependent oxidoreductase [Geodermatophilus sp. DF01_2]TFV59823.1 SDR family oxidoreductase [Geodermatophilus sp. DF01_2]